MGQQTTYSTMPAIGYSGTLDKNAPFKCLTMVNAEATSAIPFGKGVKRKSGATTDFQATFPAAQGDKILGIVERLTTYARTWTDADGNTLGQLNATGLVPGTMMSVATEGRMLVTVATGCTAGQGLHIYAVANAGKVPGDIANAADSTNTVDCTTQARFESSCAAGGLAWLVFDFANI